MPTRHEHSIHELGKADYAACIYREFIATGRQGLLVANRSCALRVTGVGVVDPGVNGVGAFSGYRPSDGEVRTDIGSNIAIEQDAWGY